MWILCEQQFYNNTTFHRVIPGFMIRAAVSPASATEKTKPAKSR
ncbi:peptidylprolyl isomerase [Shigella flexneri]